MAIESKDVWKAFEKNPEINNYPGKMQEAIKPTVEKLPEILADKLDNPVTVSTLIDAKFQLCLYHSQKWQTN
jgi:hypothetical protein